MNLSKNLTLAEVTKSTTAKRRGINNEPDDWTIARKNSMLRSAGQFAVSTFKVEHSILTQMYSEAVQTVRSSNTFSTISRLISSFGSLVIKTILIGFTCLMCGMVLIVEGASRLAETKRVKCITNRFSAKDSKRKKA
jgi:hypothetical protein